MTCAGQAIFPWVAAVAQTAPMPAQDPIFPAIARLPRMKVQFGLRSLFNRDSVGLSLQSMEVEVIQ